MLMLLLQLCWTRRGGDWWYVCQAFITSTAL